MTVLAWQRGGIEDGPAVVLIHSWASDSMSDWASTGWPEALSAAGCGVYVCDLPGHGESGNVHLPERTEPGGWSARTILTDLDTMGVRRAAVVGYADGGITAGHIAAIAPERTTHLVFIGCDDTNGIPGGRKLGPVLRNPAARLWDPEVATKVGRAREDQRHHQPTLGDWADRLAWPAAPRLGALRTPVLLAVGKDDPDRRERTPRLASLFHDARVMTVPGDRETSMSTPELHRAVSGFITHR